MTKNAHEPELTAAVERMEAAQRTIEQRSRDGADLTATYEELDEAVRDYETAVPKWREGRGA